MTMETAVRRPGAWNAVWIGAGLVRRRRRVLWWLFLVNFLLGMAATLPTHRALAAVLDHTLASQSLVSHFDFTMFVDAMKSGNIDFAVLTNVSLLAALLFALAAMFAEAGIIQEFRAAAGVTGPSQPQTGAEFFGACGAFWGRIFRLLLWSLVPLGIVGIAYGVYQGIAHEIASHSTDENVDLSLKMMGGTVFFLFLTIVRAWTGIAKIHLVTTGERATGRVFFDAARKLAFGNLGKVFTIQLVTSLAVLATGLLGLTVWMKLVPPARVGMAFLVSELTLLVTLACGLWQKAALVSWYERHQAWQFALQPPPLQTPLPATQESTLTGNMPAPEPQPFEAVTHPEIAPPSPNDSLQ